MTEAQVEAVARAYCRRMGMDPDAKITGTNCCYWELHLDAARDAISERAMREALDEVLK